MNLEPLAFQESVLTITPSTVQCENLLLLNPKYSSVLEIVAKYPQADESNKIN